MPKVEVQFQFRDSKLRKPFLFGDEKLKSVTHLLVREKTNPETIGEYPFFPGRSSMSSQDLNSEFSRGALSKEGSSILEYCRDQIDFLRSQKGKDFHPFRVNAVLGSDQIHCDKIQSLIGSGFDSIKLKLTPQNWESVIDALDRSQADFKANTRFRLDSNGSFQPNQVVEVSQKLQDFPIEFWEDPMPFGDPYFYQYMTKESPFPIALDETILSLEQGLELLKSKCCNLLMLKPATLMDIKSLYSSIDNSPDLRNQVVLSSLFESTIGTHFLQILASALRLQNYAHGFSTYTFFENAVDTLKPLVFKPIRTFGILEGIEEESWKAL